MKEKLQRIGGALAGMIIPNMGAFIAWGLLTAFFISTGWIPNEGFASIVSPMLSYLLPILIAYTGGKMVHGVRGGVVGATITIGIIVGTDVPQFLGAMIMGPLGGWLIKLIDDALEDKIPVGFEMLINNFTAGILALILTLLGYKFMSPILTAISSGAEAVVDWLVNARLLPLAALIVEPAKVLFLNNALNHGVLAPLGVAAVEKTGKAIHFLLETNPGPGLGLLVAYYVAGKGLLKESAPGAMIVHFLGGIHEMYFPFVLAHPIMILSVIAGGLAADFWFTITGAGLVATPSPGSIFAYLAVIPKGQHFSVLMGVLIGAVASFLIGFILLKSVVKQDVDEEVEEEIEESAAVPGLG